MDNKTVHCPYCGCIIENETEKCPQCREYFVERTLPIKIESLGLFIIFNFFTLGLYQSIWLFLNLHKINDMAFSNKDKLKLDIPVIMLVLSGLFLVSQVSSYIIYLLGTMSKLMLIIAIVMWLLSSPLFWIIWILMYIISYRVLRIIEKYTYEKYDIKIYHSETGWLFAPVIAMPILNPFFYLIYFIYTYKERVYNPKPINI